MLWNRKETKQNQETYYNNQETKKNITILVDPILRSNQGSILQNKSVTACEK
jgi:hypothetical protein